MMNWYGDDGPFLATFEFGVQVCSKPFIGVEPVRANVCKANFQVNQISLL